MIRPEVVIGQRAIAFVLYHKGDRFCLECLDGLQGRSLILG
ncbi:hypothetical protein [Leptolyngbya sp. CCY15150]|nr:hypothetical protein [Leptolyngbya sp. CCY15150]